MNTAKRKNLKVENVKSSGSAFLAPLEVAFAAGNYWQVRKLVFNIEKDAQASARDKAESLSMLVRIKADPAVLALALLGIVSFIMASWISVN